MRFLTILAALAALAGCGVDGAPTRPEKKQSTPIGVTITGKAEVGVVGRSVR